MADSYSSGTIPNVMNSHPISQDDLEDGLSPVDGSTTHENDPTQLDIGSSTSKNPNVTSAVFSLVSYPEADQLLAESHMPSVDREKARVYYDCYALYR